MDGWHDDDGDTLFIDGKWLPADDGRTFDVTDPSNGRVIGRAADAGAAETDRAIAAAEAAFGSLEPDHRLPAGRGALDRPPPDDRARRGARRAS